MTPSYKKRFWTRAEVRPDADGFGVYLDDRLLTTPARAPLHLPTEALAAEIAGEWLAQTDSVDPQTMPATRMANSAIDLMSVQFDAVSDMLTDYGESDLICYRADAPEELVAQQARAWDPLVDWAATELRAPLNVTTGILPVAQPAPSLAALRDLVRGHDPFQLAALHDLVTLSGSLVIGLAAEANHLGAASAWRASRVDETWQEQLWGTDEEAAETARVKQSQFAFAHRFLGLLDT